MPGAGQGLRDVAGRQKSPLAGFGGRRAKVVRIGIERPRFLRGPRRQKRDLIDHVFHFVAERRLRRRRKRRRTHLCRLQMDVAVAVPPELREGLVSVRAAGFALVAALHYPKGAAMLQAAGEALALMDEERRLAREGDAALFAHETHLDVQLATGKVRGARV